jgi:hypothetical protein
MTGKGKSICPALLGELSRRSFVVFDPKDEVAAIRSSRPRKGCVEGNVKIVNSFGVPADCQSDLKSDGWNPLADLDTKLRPLRKKRGNRKR